MTRSADTPGSSRSVVAIVPMRHDSQRVRGKNYRLLGGKPLYHHIIDSLAAASGVSRIVVDTDSDRIWHDVGRNYPEIILLRRPARLADDMASAHEIVRNTVEQVDAPHFLQTHATNPLLTTATIDAAIEAFFAAWPSHDSLFTVTRQYKRYYTCAGDPINHDPLAIIRTQDLEPLLEENSCLYIFDREMILRRRMRVGERPLLFPTPADESIDIDNELDVVIADAVFQQRPSTA